MEPVGKGGAGLRRHHLWLHGRVQGVGFRESLRRQADLHGVGGWTRNLPDGGLEAVLEGPAAQVAAVEAWCHHGPPGARVTGVHVVEETPRGERGFAVPPTPRA